MGRRTVPVPSGAWPLFAVFLAAALIQVRVAADPAPEGMQEQGRSALERFRQSLWSEPTFLQFDLIEMPRRGDEHAMQGRLWGGRDAAGPVTRFEIDVGRGGFTHRVLIHSGLEPAVWTADGPVAGTPDPAGFSKPLAPGLEMTAFDLGAPYLYWLDSACTGEQRIRGRMSFVYAFTPSADFVAGNPGVRTVRAYLDAQYAALVQSEIFDASGVLSKTLSLLELRKVGDRWILKDVDVRNEASRNKTRLSVTGVAVGTAPAAWAFDPARLGDRLEPPPGDRVKQVSQ